MKFMKMNSLSPKRLFRSRSDKDKDKDKPATPTSVLPDMSGDWSDFSSADTSSTSTHSHHLDLAQAFKLIDRDNDGLVSTQQLEALLSRLLPSHDDVAVMLREVDRHGHGCIPLDALLHRFGPPCEPAADSELREAFEVFDTDHDGKISAEELFSVFAAIGDDRCTLEECRRMIAEVDKNGDGFVCFQDFALMMDLQR
ncbi:probable calcium-binding protein CML35 [Argentina anserina]|uniref:probable calcium-binding protein CML35 n=1 Tax=Argentina anserina TaxID=57926 RepID=UPI00217661DE|nr:probable calcium-binding protein CML35 [Potentilla anserina]